MTPPAPAVGPKMTTPPAAVHSAPPSVVRTLAPVLQSLPEVPYTDASPPQSKLALADVIRGLPTETRTAVGDTVLIAQLTETADRCGLPHDRIAEVLAQTRTNGVYDPSKLFGRYADLLTPEELDTRFRQLLLMHPELRNEFFGDNYRSILGQGIPQLGVSIVGLLGFEKVADLVGIRDPSARFAFIIGGAHAMHPLLATTGDAARTAYRQLVRGKFITHAYATEKEIIAFTRTNSLGSTMWQIAKGHMGIEGKTLAEKMGSVLQGVGRCAASPMSMGRDILWSRLWTSLLGGNNTRTVDGIEVPTENRVAQVVGFLGFFTEQVANMLTKGAYGAWIESPSLSARLLRGAGWAQAIGFSADLSALFSNWITFGDGSRAAAAQQFRIGDLAFGSAENPFAGGLVGLLRWAGLGRGFIDNLASADNPVMNEVLQLLTFRSAPEHVEWSATFIASLVREQDAARIGQHVDQFRALMWGLVIWGDVAADALREQAGGSGMTFEKLAAQYRQGFLDRVDTPAALRSYRTDHDGRISYYNFVRAFESLRNFPIAARIADFFDEDFREENLGSSDLTSGMRVLAEDGWAQLVRFVAGDHGLSTILERRNINFYRQALAADIALASAKFDHEYQPSPQSAMTVASAAATARQWADLAKEVHRLEAGGLLTADAQYYRALGEVTRTIATQGEESQRTGVQRWLRQRMTQLLDPTLPAATRQRLITELKVVNPNVFFAYNSLEARQASQLMAHAPLSSQPIQPTLDSPARTAMKEAANFWIEQGSYDLYLDVHAQVATLGGGFPDAHSLALATLKTHAALNAQKYLNRVTDRIAFLEAAQKAGESANYDWGGDHCVARLPGDPCAGRRSLVADLEHARQERTALLEKEAVKRHPVLADTSRFFRYAADAARWSPGSIVLPAGIDPATGEPDDWGPYVRAFVEPHLERNAKDEAQLGLLEQKPGYHYADRWAPYRTAKLRQYHATATEIGKTMARWVVEAKVLGQDPQTYIDRQLAAPTGRNTRALMQQQIVREKLAEFDWGNGYHASTLFGAHGAVTHYPDLFDWVERNSPHQHHELSTRVLNVVGQWYGEAIAHGVEDPTTVQSLLEDRLNTPAAQSVRRLIGELVRVEAQPGRHPQLGAFTVDANTGKVSVRWSALRHVLTMKGLRPYHDANTPSYLHANVQHHLEVTKDLLQIAERAYAAADPTQQATIRPQLDELRGVRDRLQAWLDRPAKMAALYRGNTAVLEDKFVAAWNNATRSGAVDVADRRAHIAAYLKTPDAALVVLMMRQQLDLLNEPGVSGTARAMYNARGEIIDWDRFERWIRATGRVTQPPAPVEFKYARPGFKM